MRVAKKWISPGVVFGFLLVFLLLFSPNIFANEPTVTIQVLAEKIVPGNEIQIQVTVTHNSSSFIHHVEWVTLVINDLQSYQWTYSARDLPPAGTFKKVVKYRVPEIENIRIDAEAYCIRHGSSGKVTEIAAVKK